MLDGGDYYPTNAFHLGAIAMSGTSQDQYSVLDFEPRVRTRPYDYPYQMDGQGGLTCLTPDRHLLMFNDLGQATTLEPDAVHSAPDLFETIQDNLFHGGNHG